MSDERQSKTGEPLAQPVIIVKESGTQHGAESDLSVRQIILKWPPGAAPPQADPPNRRTILTVPVVAENEVMVVSKDGVEQCRMDADNIEITFTS